MNIKGDFIDSDDNEILEEEDFIFREMRDIQDQISSLKSEMNIQSDIEEKDNKEEYTSRKHDFRITSMIFDCGNIEVPDIMGDIEILKELMNEKELDDEEKKIIHKEYVAKVETLVEAVNNKKDSIEKLYNYMNNIKFN